MVDLENSNRWDPFSAPQREGRGHGRAVHTLMLGHYSQCHEVLGKAVESASRAERFYRKAG